MTLAFTTVYTQCTSAVFHVNGNMTMGHLCVYNARVYTMPKETGKELLWTDDEVELLLNVTSDYKTKKAAESVDWESVKCNIMELFKAELPDGEEERFSSMRLPSRF